jgi:aryl-phospho-beta-D-glucosidase BglC (GH1 family)
MAVILDLHEVPNENSKTYSQDRKAQKSEFWNDPGNLDTMIECWRQLAAICQERKQIIWFDILNEPLDWNDFPSYAKKWPDWAQKTIDAIRLLDKDQRPIVIEVGPGGLCWGFEDFPLLKGENIIYSTHNYQPHYYTHQGISDLNNTDLAQAFLKTNQPWPGVYGDTGGGMWDKARLYKELAPMIEFQKKHKVRIYISEFGVVRWAPNAEKYIRDSLEVYEEFGWDWSFHALHENPMWSPDYESRYLENVLAKEPTPVGLVLQEFFSRNWVAD